MMKIAQVAPIWYRIPPKKYGGTELVVTNLTEGLVAKGHEVTLFATADSQTKARLIPTTPIGILEQGKGFEEAIIPLNHTLTALEMQDQFDIIHFHFTNKFDYINLALTKNIPKILYTLHVPLPIQSNLQNKRQLFEDKFNTIPFVSISNNQRADMKLNFLSTIYHGIHINHFPFLSIDKNNAMLWLSRISYQKGPYEALQIALKLKFNIIFVGKVDMNAPKDVIYFDNKIKPLLQNPKIQFVDEADFETKTKYYSESKLFILPIQWEEPFGLIFIESMACGTPVVAYARGSVPEVIKDGETGFIVNSSDKDIRGDWIVKKTGFEGLCEAVERIYAMPEAEYRQMRRNCRAHVEQHFTVERMVDEYEKVYEQILSKTAGQNQPDRLDMAR